MAKLAVLSLSVKVTLARTLKNGKPFIVSYCEIRLGNVMVAQAKFGGKYTIGDAEREFRKFPERFSFTPKGKEMWQVHILQEKIAA